MGGKVVHEFLGKDTKGTSLDREVIMAERTFLADAKVKLYNSPNHHQDWLDCIKSRNKPICDVAIGASTVISCHLMNQAYYHGGTMKWNPENPRIHQRRRRQMAHPRLSRRVEGLKQSRTSVRSSRRPRERPLFSRSPSTSAASRSARPPCPR
jgi:hypothetical protein